MTNIYSESLAALSNKSAFKAEIIGAKVQESSNLFTNEGRIVTNHYFIWLRSAEGSERILRGLNVPAAELSRVKQLEEGKSYIFPNALLE